MNKFESVEEIQERNEKKEIYVNALIKDKLFKIYCGDGRQKLQWLADCAVYKYENYAKEKKKCGCAFSIQLETGDVCDLNQKISDVISKDCNVWIMFKEEYELYQEDHNN